MRTSAHAWTLRAASRLGPAAGCDRPCPTLRPTRPASAASTWRRRLRSTDAGSSPSTSATALARGRADEVFQAAEHARAVISRLSPVRPPEDEQTADLLTELRRAVEALRGVQEDQVATARLLDERADLEAQIAARGWGRGGRREIRRAVSSRRIEWGIARHGAGVLSPHRWHAACGRRDVGWFHVVCARRGRCGG